MLSLAGDGLCQSISLNHNPPQSSILLHNIVELVFWPGEHFDLYGSQNFYQKSAGQ